MVESKILELGVGLIAALLIIREVLGFVGKLTGPKGNGSNGGHGTNGNGSAVMGGHVADIRGGVFDIKDKVDDLYNWHNQRDANGIPLWYLQPSLEQSIKKLTAQIDRSVEVQAKNDEILTRILDHVVIKQHSIQEVLDEIRGRK